MYMVVSLGNIFELVNPLKGSWEPSDPTLRTTSTHPDDTSFTPIHPLDRSLGVYGQGGLSPAGQTSCSPPITHTHIRLSGCAARLCVRRAGLLTAGWRSLSTSVLRAVLEVMID